jgi:hypothetical protein
MSDDADEPGPTTPAGKIAQERFEQLHPYGPNEWGYPDAARFLPADVEHAGEALIHYAKSRRPAVLVFPDGDEVVILHFETRRDTPPPPVISMPFTDRELRNWAQIQREQHDRWMSELARRPLHRGD